MNSNTKPSLPLPDSSQEQPCPRCGVVDTPLVVPGTGPHYAKALCAHCGTFLRWVSRYSHEELVHRRERFRRAAMARLLPTPKQLAHLQLLGYAGEMPQDRRAASDLIDTWRAKRGLA